MSSRYVGIAKCGTPTSWVPTNVRSTYVAELEAEGCKVFGYGPRDIIPMVSGMRNRLIDAMTRIGEAPAGQGFVELRYDEYIIWRDGIAPTTPKSVVNKKRKMFESDFEKLSEDGMLLTREHVSAEDAWNATLLACGVKPHDSKGD